MNNILEMLVDMDKELNKVIAREKAKNEAINKETEMLVETMTSEIAEDLKELRCYRETLGIKKDWFESTIYLKSNKTNESFPIGITFSDDNVRIDTYEHRINGKGEDDIAITNICFRLDGIYKGWKNITMCSAIYKNWNTIKKDVEEQFVKEYFKLKEEECGKISLEREIRLRELSITKSIF